MRCLSEVIYIQLRNLLSRALAQAFDLAIRARPRLQGAVGGLASRSRQGSVDIDYSLLRLPGLVATVRHRLGVLAAHPRNNYIGGVPCL